MASHILYAFRRDEEIEPALEAPPGVDSNFENPPNRNYIAHIVHPIALTIAAICILIRGYSRLFIIRKVRIEDYIALVGCIFFVAFCVNDYVILNKFGFFVHQWNVPASTMPDFAQTVNHSSIMYNLVVGPLKVAILVEWCRIFVPYPNRGLYFWAFQTLIFINTAFYFAGLCMGIWPCIPREFIWDKTIPGGRCLNSRSADLASASLNLILDLGILLLPQGVIWKLNMPLHQKIGVSVIFAVGILCCAAATLRLYYTYLWLTEPDIIYASSSVLLTIVAESVCMILILCIPAAPKLFTNVSFLSRIVTSLQHWTRFSSRHSRPSQEESKQHTPKANITLRPTDDRYVALRSIKNGGNTSSDSREELTGDAAAAGPGIVQTTRFTLREDRNGYRNGQLEQA